MNRKTAREHWQKITEQNIDKITAALLEASTQTKTSWLECPHCGRKSQFEIPDARARSDAAKTLHELGGLKPKAEEPEAAAFVVKRTVVKPHEVEAAQADGGVE